MAIYLIYDRLNKEQEIQIRERIEPYEKEISELTLQPRRVQLVLNDDEISVVRGQEVIDILVEILEPTSWGTDLPKILLQSNQPPAQYTSRYNFPIPYVEDLP